MRNTAAGGLESGKNKSTSDFSHGAISMEAVAADGGSDGENAAGKSNTPAARIRRASATAGRESGVLGVRRLRPCGAGSRLSAGGHRGFPLCETRPPAAQAPPARAQKRQDQRQQQDGH